MSPWGGPWGPWGGRTAALLAGVPLAILLVKPSARRGLCSMVLRCFEVFKAVVGLKSRQLSSSFVGRGSGSGSGNDPPGMVWESQGGFWEVSSFDLALRLLRQEDKHTANVVPHLRKLAGGQNADGRFDELLEFIEAQILSLEGPEYRSLHRQLVRHFTPKAVRELEAVVQEEWEACAEACAKEERAHGKWDVVAHLARPLPLRVMMRVLGLPPSDAPKLMHWGDAIEEVVGGHDAGRWDRGLKAVREFEQYLSGQLRTCKPGSLVANLHAACLGSGGLRPQLFAPNVLFMLLAGNESTAALISGSVLALLEHPEQLARLEHDPLLPSAMDELVRFTSPVARIYRSAASRGWAEGAIAPGEGVQFVLGCPLRRIPGVHSDPSLFPEPFDLRLDRDPKATKRHMGFGQGVHSCIGLRLAKVEAQVAVEGVARHAADGGRRLRLAGPQEGLKWRELDSINYLESLPVLRL